MASRQTPLPAAELSRTSARDFIMFLELVWAICITIGFLTRPFALLLLIEMLFITFKVQMPNGWFFSAQGGGAEFTVMWAALFLIILIRGGGPHSVDRAIGKEF